MPLLFPLYTKGEIYAEDKSNPATDGREMANSLEFCRVQTITVNHVETLKELSFPLKISKLFCDLCELPTDTAAGRLVVHETLVLA